MPGTEVSARAEDLMRLTQAVRDAGALALDFFGKEFKSWTKHGDAPVTEADIAANELLKSRLATGADGEGWLSEESDNDPSRLTARRVWVVDPIDGTRAYMARRPDWSISAALVEDGRPTVAAVFAPVSNEMFVAIAGQGATCNGVTMRATAGAALEVARVAGPKRALDWMTSRTPGLQVVPRIYSLALRIVRVAQGEIDAAMAGGDSHDWDLAAADLLVHEAGGILTSLDGQALTYNRADPVHGVLVAAGRERHSALLALVRAQRESA